MSERINKTCVPCEGGAEPLTNERADALLSEINGWIRSEKQISKTFEFRNYYQTMAFVNASAYISHREDHHPDLLVGYKTCRVTYTTHAVEGLTENDFICALAIVDTLDDEAANMPIVTERKVKAGLNRVLSNSFGFGGTNACLVMERYTT